MHATPVVLQPVLPPRDGAVPDWAAECGQVIPGQRADDGCVPAGHDTDGEECTACTTRREAGVDSRHSSRMGSSRMGSKEQEGAGIETSVGVQAEVCQQGGRALVTGRTTVLRDSFSVARV